MGGKKAAATFSVAAASALIGAVNRAGRLQKVALLLPAGSRGNDFLWIFRSAFFASFVHSYRPDSLDLLFFVVSLHLAVL